MEMKKAQKDVKEFDEVRGWKGDWFIKDLSLNLVEEVGELWDMVKWIDEEKQRKIIKENKQEAADFIGDSLFLILKMANKMDVDVEEAFEMTMKDYEKRFPPEKMKKAKHGNKRAGGIDEK